MSNYKNLADLVKVCSVLPIFAVMPAMAEEYTVVPEDTISETQTVSGSYQWLDASTAITAKNQSVWFIKGADVTVSSGAVFANNKADSGVFSTSSKAPSSLTLNSGVVFENNAVCFDGGAVANYDTLNANGVTFRKNTAQIDFEKDTTPMGGGAIALGSESKTMIQNSVFSQNESKYHGGAVAMRGPNDGDNSAADLDILDSEFNGNIAAKNGGAIYSTFYDSENVKDSVYIEDTDFVANSAELGGAIYNEGIADKKANKASMKIVGGEFENNIALSEGGAIFNKGNMNIVGAEFDGNLVVDGYGGAIKNNGILVAENVEFTNNLAYVNGAFSTSSKTGTTTITDAKFVNNHALADGGALGLYLDATVTGAYFQNNTAGKAVTIDGTDYEAASNANGGGALYAGQKVKATLKDVHFLNNVSGVSGGAVSARHNTSKDGGYLKFEDAEFVNNQAVNYGGALESIYDGEVYFNNATFAGNIAGKSGGAIYNGVDKNYYNDEDDSVDSTNHGIFYLSGTNTFTGNTAGEFGGAIYNDNGGTINMSGKNTFANNTHGKYAAANDIYNLGTLNITDGTTTIGGGIAGNEGTLVLENGATLNIGTALIQQGTVNLDGAIVASAMNSKSFGRFDGDVTVGGNATLDLTVGSVGTYDIFAGKTIDVSKVTVGDTYLVESGADGIVITTKAVEDIAADTGLTTQAAGMISGLANSTNKNVQKISLAAQQLLNSGDVETVEKEVAKANPDGKPVVQAAATSVQNQVLAVAAGRMSGTAPVVGRSGGDEAKSNGFWAQGLFNKSKYADQFHGYTRGFALGADTMINSAFTLGAGFAYNNSDIHTVGRGHTDIDANTLFVYGQYKPTNWFVNGTLAYTMAEYTEDTKMLGNSLVATYDVDSYGAQIMTGYDFASGITTEVGARYLHIAQDSYSNGLTSVRSMDSDFLTGVAGMKYAFTIENDWAVKLRPELRAAVTYDFVADGDEAVVTMPGVASYKVAGERLKRLGGEFGIGLTALYNGMEITAMYDLDLHEDYTSHTGMIKFRGQF